MDRTRMLNPANFTYHWQRELKDKLRKNDGITHSDFLRANSIRNPYLNRDQVATLDSWVSRVEDPRDNWFRCLGDIVIVDEALDRNAHAGDEKTLASSARGPASSCS